jgi:hypothetical protein
VQGLPRNPGGLLISVARVGRETEDQIPGCLWPACCARGGANEQHALRYPQAKETKCGGMDEQKSESPIVPGKPGNRPRRDLVEGRGGRVVELKERKMSEPLTSGSVSTKLQRIAEMARKYPERSFRSIHHVIDIEWLREAYRRTRKDAAVGVDGQTAADYAANLEGNLQSLLDRFKSGSYRAPPVRRVHIPKGDGRKTRPIGLPTFEDKVLQRAVSMVVSAIYEPIFLDSSYGFRLPPARVVHSVYRR